MDTLTLQFFESAKKFSLIQSEFDDITESLMRYMSSFIASSSLQTYNENVAATSISSDTILATKALAGDSAAFDAIVDRYGAPLYGYARRLTGNTADGEDIAQETFVRLYEHLPKLDLSQPLKPWLFRVCTNLCRNLAKKKKSLTFSQLESDDESEYTSFLDSIDSDEIPLSEKFDQSERKKHVQAAVNDLPQKYQIVISLYYFQGLSYEEIATVLTLPINTVRTHIKRAKSLLSTALQPLLTS
jgi:RNA polymerase sigma-70 factor, ECF subfamily